MAASDLFDAYGTYLQGMSRSAQLRLRAQIDAQNAYMARQAAASEQQAGAAEAGRLGMKASELIGEQKAGYAAGGVDVSAGSPVQAMADTRMMSALDQTTILNNTARKALGYQVAAAQGDAQSQLYRNEANENDTETWLSSAGKVLSGSMGTFMNSQGG